jgi:AcrR family transcriptional regulator
VATQADTAKEPGRTRKSAEQRREEIVAAAFGHFAVSGYNGASTEAIARDAGISQPYLFRLFGTKRELFLACQERSGQRIRETFERAAEGVPQEERLGAMGEAYVGLLADRQALLFQMQSYAACSDPVIQAQVREGYSALVARVTELSGAQPHEVWQFFSFGMLLNVIASLDLAAIADESEWAKVWCDPTELMAAARAA